MAPDKPSATEPSSGFLAGPVKFFRDSYLELRRVTWPDRQQTWRMTIIVIVFSAVVGVMLGLLGLLFHALFGLLLPK